MNSEAVDNLHNNQDAFNVKQEPGVQGGNGNQQKFNNFANSSSPAMGTTGANSGMPAPGSGDQFDPNLEIKQENGAKVWNLESFCLKKVDFTVKRRTNLL